MLTKCPHRYFRRDAQGKLLCAQCGKEPGEPQMEDKMVKPPLNPKRKWRR